VAALLSSLEADFGANVWSRASVDTMETTIASLERLAADEAASAQQRLIQRLAAAIEAELARAALTPEAMARVEESLALLTAYQEQGSRVNEAEISQQSRYKQSLCLLALERAVEAERILEQLGSEPGERWPALAACQVWARLVQRRQLLGAEGLFETVSSRWGTEALASVVPHDRFGEIVTGYLYQGLTVKRNPNRLRQCERAAKIAELFQTAPGIRYSARECLAEALSESGEVERAEKIWRDLIAELRAPGTRARIGESLGTPVGPIDMVLVHYCRVLRSTGRAKEALEEIDRWIQARSDGISDFTRGRYYIGATRGRCLAALGRWEEAEQTVEELLRLVPLQSISDRSATMDVCLLYGFLKERRGDLAEANRIWREGLRPGWTGSNLGDLARGIMITSLLGELSESDADAVIRRVAELATDDSPLVLMQRSIGDSTLAPALTPAVRGAFRSRRGRELVRKFALGEDVAMGTFIQVIAYQGFRQGALTGDVDAQQDDVVWEAAQHTCAAVMDGELGNIQVIQLALSWKGTSGLMGWAGVAPTLKPELRGPLAYVLGHRLLRLNQPQDAAMLFRMAAADAPEDSPLKKLAQTELDRLTAKPQTLKPQPVAEPATPKR
jgi:tetratricopeptide (TPR) repeat protein